MRRLLPILLFVACSRETAAPPAAPPTTTTQPPVAAKVAPTKPAEVIERGAFVVVRDGKPLYREQFIRTPTRFESDVAASGANERVLQQVQLNPDATVVSTYVRIFSAGGVEQMGILIRGENAAVEIIDRKGVSQTKQGKVPPGTIPSPVPESLMVLEQVIRRARVIGGSSVDVPILPGTLKVQRVKVIFRSADTAEVRTADATILAKIDAAGRLLSATEPNQKITIRRE
jgi:hypothetical protein